MATEEREQRQPESERLGQAERGHPVAQLAAIGVIASLLGIALGLLIDWWPLQASTQADKIDTLYDVLIIASVPMFVLVMTVVLYCVWRFRMKPGEEDKDGPPMHGNTKLEVIWTAIPAIMMLALCSYSYVVLRDIEEAPAAGTDSEMNVRVVGEQFSWTFFYPAEQEGGEELASAQLYLPVGKSVKFNIQSKDVLHDFWVPAWRMKMDAVPGIQTTYRVTPKTTGRFPVVCAELCGLGHAVMRQSAVIVEQQEFDEWLAEQREGGEEEIADAGGDDAEVDGKVLFTAAQPSCGACHTFQDAGTQSTTGPNLDESLKGKDADYIRESIVQPDAQIAQGFGPGIMPPDYEERLDPAEIDALVDYLSEATR